MLVSNEKMDPFSALREYCLREKTEEGSRTSKLFQKKLNELKNSLAIPTGDPAHDRSDTIKKEKALLNWLNGMSMAKLFDWFDVAQENT